MSDYACPTCGGPLDIRAAQIVQLPDESPKTYVDYQCPSPGCRGSLRVALKQASTDPSLA
jgi:predicted RNA-binding Zn-ribbon protein involved in translation (DUF1610 family)